MHPRLIEVGPISRSKRGDLTYPQTEGTYSGEEEPCIQWGPRSCESCLCAHNKRRWDKQDGTQYSFGRWQRKKEVWKT